MSDKSSESANSLESITFVAGRTCGPSAGVFTLPLYYNALDASAPGMTPEKSLQRARLFAAAPELLSAAVDAVESLGRLPDVDGAYRTTVIQQLQSAIRKATGGAK